MHTKTVLIELTLKIQPDFAYQTDISAVYHAES